MTRIEGQVGIGPGWPPSRTKRPVVVSVRYPARLVDGETVIEPVWADVRTTGAGKFAIDDVAPGAILLRIQHGGYVATRALLVPASPETVDYATLVEVDPSTLEPLPTLPSSADLLAEVDAALATTVQGGAVDDETGHLILAREDGSTFDAGLVRGTDGDPGDPGPPGPSGVVQYTDAAEASAVNTTETGIVHLDDMAALFPSSDLAGRSGDVLIVTTATNYVDGPETYIGLVQRAAPIYDPWNGVRLALTRKRYASDSSWGPWEDEPLPASAATTFAAFTSGNVPTTFATFAATTAPAGNGQKFRVTDANWGTTLGLSQFAGVVGRFEGFIARVQAGAAFHDVQYVTLWDPTALELVRVVRHRVNAGAWSTWAVG